MPRSGPAPKPQTRRRNRRPEFRQLDPAGCDLPVPRWPMGGQKPKALLERWDDLWHRPQAELWHEVQTPEFVALYCKKSLEAEKSNAPVTLINAVVRMAGELGLTPDGLAKLRCEILDFDDEEGEKEAGDVSDFEAARDRLRGAG